MEKDLGVPVDEKLNMSQECVLAARKANCILGCIKRGMTSMVGRRHSVLFPHEAPSGVLCPILGLPAKGKHGSVRVGPVGGGMKMIRELEHFSHDEGLRELGMFSLEKRRLWEDLVVASST